MRSTLLLLVAALPAAAQPGSVEVFGSVGAFKAAGDEGGLGSGATYGGAVTIGLTRRLAIDLDAQTGRIERLHPGTVWRLRRTLILPGLRWRFGSGRVRLFAGGGVGAQVNRPFTRESNFVPEYTPPPPWVEVAPRVFEVRVSDSEPNVHGRAGFLIAPVSRLLVRVDFYAAWRYVLPDAGVKIALGWRIR